MVKEAHEISRNPLLEFLMTDSPERMTENVLYLVDRPVFLNNKDWSSFQLARHSQLRSAVGATLVSAQDFSTTERSVDHIMASACREACLRNGLINKLNPEEKGANEFAEIATTLLDNALVNSLLDPDNKTPGAILFRSTYEQMNGEIERLRALRNEDEIEPPNDVVREPPSENE